MIINSVEYTTGLARNQPNPQVAHLYKGEFHDMGDPMCRHGWTNPGLFEYSICRNNEGPKGICKICMKNAEKGKKPISWDERFGKEWEKLTREGRPSWSGLKI